MGEFVDVHIWIEGRFEHHPYVRYIGGKMVKIPKCDLDKLNLDGLYAIYVMAGGKRHSIVDFYYQMPAYSLDVGLRKITNFNFTDWNIGSMVDRFTGCGIPLVIYTEEVNVDWVCFDTQGNIIQKPSQSQVEVQFAHVDDPQSETNAEKEVTAEADIQLLLKGIDFSHDADDEADKNKEVVQEFETEAEKEQPGMQKTPSTRKRTDFDDSSDNDFLTKDVEESSGEYETDSEDGFCCPDAMLVDIEDSGDEDIHLDQNPTKAELIVKLQKMLKKSKQKASSRNKPISSTQNDVTEDVDDWYSDPKEDDDPHQLDATDPDGQQESLWFTEGTDMKLFKPFVTQKFKDAKWYRECLRDYCIREGFDLHFIRNENSRITARCLNTQCTWRIHASPIQGSSVFQIKTLKGQHVCARTYDNKLAKAKYLATRVENVIRENPRVGIETLKQTIYRKVSVDASKWKVSRAKKAALDKIHGLDSMQYELLWDYCETVRARNPGSKILLKKKEGSDPPMFERMYFSLEAMKKGFLAGCRPLIQLDGCFLKTVYGGQLLVAVGRDGNDNMWPIAMAVVPVENRPYWTWFLEELLEDIGMETKWTFLSDRQKGLMEAVSELCPYSEHRYCVRHLYQNFKDKFKTNELKELFWKVASIGNKIDYERNMKKMEKADPKVEDKIQTASEWMRAIPPQHWARSYFQTNCKCDVLVNNLSESFNAYILVARNLPIISMFEWVRTKLMSRIQTKKAMMMRFPGSICPNVMKKIRIQQRYARNCFAMYCGGAEYEITQVLLLDKFIVDLEKRTCTCGMFQLCGYPCCHAHAAITERRDNVEDYVDNFFTKKTYLKVYDNMIHGVHGQKDYIKTNFEPLRAPNIKAKKGRPTKARRKGADEGGPSNSTRKGADEGGSSKSARKGLTHTCQRCLTTGHNKGSCTNPPHPKSKYYKGPPQVPRPAQVTPSCAPAMRQKQPVRRAFSAKGMM